MSSEITVHTGGIGDIETIHVDWLDENNIHHSEIIEVRTLNQDKPRIVEVWVNGILAHPVTSAQVTI